MALDKYGIAKRIAQEVKDGYYVNLGIGIPTLVANYIPSDMQVMLQSENGLLGMGAFPSKDLLKCSYLLDRARLWLGGDMLRL